jgi:hypothetical protein
MGSTQNNFDRFCGLNRSNNSNEPLFSFEQEPWSFLPKNMLRPRNVDYVHEITRRATLYNIAPAPRPNNWTRAQIMEWLERNPVCDPPDITFLTNEVLRLEDVLSRRVQELPLAQSIKDLAESQRQLVLDRAEDCSRERQLEEQSRQSERSEQCRKRVFDRRSELNDLARQYRRLNAELDPSDTNSQRLSDFYVSEGCLLQEEIDRLDNNNDNLP